MRCKSDYQPLAPANLPISTVRAAMSLTATGICENSLWNELPTSLGLALVDLKTQNFSVDRADYKFWIPASMQRGKVGGIVNLYNSGSQEKGILLLAHPH